MMMKMNKIEIVINCKDAFDYMTGEGLQDITCVYATR